MNILKKMKKTYNYIKTANLLQSIVVAIAVCTVFNLTTSNVLYLIVAIMYLLLKKYELPFQEKKERKATVVVSFIFACFLILSRFEYILEIDYLLVWPIAVIVCLWGIFLCFYQLIGRLYIIVLHDSSNARIDTESKKRSFGKPFVLSLVAFIFVISVSLAFSYPGNNTRDSIFYLQIAFNDSGMLASVPIIYTFFLKWIWNIGDYMFHSPNASFALCMFIQAFLIALIESFIIAQLYIRGLRIRWCIFIWGVYGIIPYNLQLPHTLWKDIPFAMFTLLLTVALWSALSEEKNHNNGLLAGLNMLCIAISCVGMSLMRTNGYFAFLFVIPFCLICFWKDNKKIVITVILSFILVRVIQGPVYDTIITKQIKLVEMKEKQAEVDEKQNVEELHLSDIEIVEGEDTIVENIVDHYNASGIINITIQQLARVAVDISDLTEEDYARLNTLIDIEKVKETYDPYCRDGADHALTGAIKGMSTGEYLKEWLHFGLKYPIQYVLAYRDQTFGYYYPDIQYWVYTDQIQDDLTEQYGVYKNSILTNSQRESLLHFEEIYKDIPIYGLIWSIGFMVWVGFFAAGVVYCKNGWRDLIVFVPVLGVWGTLLVATPVFAEFRYMYSLFLCVPLWCALMFISTNKNRSNVNLTK